MTTTANVAINKHFDHVVKSAEDKRLYRGLELTNGMKILLISDPTTEKAAAALDVHVGKIYFIPDFPKLQY